MIQTASKALLCAIACAIAAAQAGAQPYGDPDGYSQRPNGMGPGRVVHCESHGWNRTFCPVPIRPNDRVRVVRRYSDQGCVSGQTFFTERRGIWVNDGCRADFLVVRNRPMRQAAGYGGARGRPSDRDDSGYEGNGDRDDRYERRRDQYAPRARPMPQQDRDGGDEYDDDRDAAPRYDRSAPASPYDRGPPHHGSVTVRDPDDPQDRGRRMDDCDEGDGNDDQRGDCGPPPQDPNQR